MNRRRILAFAGSTRRASFNARLVRIAAAGARAAGAECTVVDLADHRLPLYDGDLEAESGLPEAAVRLRELFADHRGLLIASPEYNGGVTAVLKNTLDWVTRAPGAVPDLTPVHGKIVATMAASPGPLGGLRGLAMLRTLLSNVGCLVLPDQVTIRAAHEAFSDDGALRHAGSQERTEQLGAVLAGWIERAEGG